MKRRLLPSILILALLLTSLSGSLLAADQTGDGSAPGLSAEDSANTPSPEGEDTVLPGDVPEGGSAADSAETDTPDADPVYHVRYSAHVQTYGWQNFVYDGAMCGTSGQSKRMEALKIEVVREVPVEKPAEDTASGETTGSSQTAAGSGSSAPVQYEVVPGAIEYCAHVQSIGWQNYVSDGALIGTSGRSLRVEAFRLRLTGELAEEYDIYYRTHIQTYGWMDWAKNNEIAGSEGMAKRMESMEICLVKKGDPAPGKTAHPYYSNTCRGDITYQTHVQSYGWMTPVADGAKGGTSGQSKRMEALKIWVNAKDPDGQPLSGSIEYATHVQTYGWQSYVSAGALSGTSGQSKRLEAIRIRLTGELADYYHVYYRVHAQTFGTLGWVCDDAVAGTEGLSKRLEFLEVRLVSKADTAAIAELNSSGAGCVSSSMIGGLTAGFYDPASGTWDNASGTKILIGASGVSRINEALTAELLTGEGAFRGGLNYEVHTSTYGWLGSSSDGAINGTPDSGKMIQAVKLSLTGEIAKYCDIYYRAHIQAYGWLGWAKNGQIAGSTGCSYRLEALEIQLVLKGAAAPGTNANYYKTVKKGSKMIALTFDDGPGARTMELLNALEKYGAHATFFVLGTNINQYSGCLSKAVSIGCEVGNHTYSHATLTGLSTAGVQSEINRTNDLIRRYTGSNAPVMRPPGGAQNATVRSAVGSPVILWSVDTNDWKTLSTSTTLNHVLNNAKDGDIILMHDIHSSTVSAAIQMIPILQSRGFELVTVSELAQAKGKPLTNGGLYSSIR